MDIFVKVVYTLFFVAFAMVIYLRQNKVLLIKYVVVVPICIGIGVLFFLNSEYRVISNQLLLLLLTFSMGIFFLPYLKNIVNLNQSPVLKNREDLQSSYFDMKILIFNIVLPALILIYQLLLIWVPAIFEQMKGSQ